jgi:hypothetical protein
VKSSCAVSRAENEPFESNAAGLTPQDHAQTINQKRDSDSSWSDSRFSSNSLLGVLPLSGVFGRREDPLVHFAGFSNETSPFQL